MMNQMKLPGLVGNFLRERRSALKLSQKALGLAFAPPVTTQFISNIERGVTPLPVQHVPTICRLLDLKEEELIRVMEREYAHRISGKVGNLPADLGEQLGNSSEVEAMRSIFREIEMAYVRSESARQDAFRRTAEELFGIRLGGGDRSQERAIG